MASFCSGQPFKVQRWNGKIYFPSMMILCIRAYSAHIVLGYDLSSMRSIIITQLLDRATNAKNLSAFPLHTTPLLGYCSALHSKELLSNVPLKKACLGAFWQTNIDTLQQRLPRFRRRLGYSWMTIVKWQNSMIRRN